MPLVFDERNLLIPGIHEATLTEVDEYFGGFQRSDRRIRLFRKLQDYVTAAKKAECGSAIILDGSFVMACIDEPGDIDLLLVLPLGWDRHAELKPYQYNLVAKRRVRQEYGFDLLAVLPGSLEEKDWTDFFQRVNIKWCRQFGWPAEARKGVVKVAL